MKRIRRDLNKRIGSSGYQQIAGDLEVRGRILGPSVSNLATGISKMSATTTTPVQLAAPTASGGYRSVVLDWERQYNLGNLSHYNLAVAQSPNGPWYVPCSDGGNWGFAEGSLPVQAEMFIHANIPPLGSADDPVGRTLYYRVQQETKSGQQSAWSEIASATTTTVQSGDLAANSIYANNIKAAEIVALLLRASNLWAGFAGVGTYENPEEGDRRIYLDGDEIRFQIYTDGAWSSERQIILGGVDSGGNFRPFLSCRGLFGDIDDVPLLDPVPDASFYRFNWDNSPNDQFGVNPWVEDIGAFAYSAGTKWEGTHSLYPDAVSLFSWADCWTVGDSVSAVFMLYPADDGFPLTLIGWDADDLENTIQLEMTSAHKIKATVMKGGTSTVLADTVALSPVSWHFVCFTYDSVTNKAYMRVDNTQLEDTPAGTWGAGTGFFSICLGGTAGGATLAMDDLIVSHTESMDVDLFFQHVIRNVAWTTESWAEDLLLKPRAGGAIRLLGDAVVSGGLRWPFLHVQDQKAANTAGGTFTSGAWQTRVLNTVLTNEITGASLAANQITLPAGTYDVEAFAPAHSVNSHQAKLYDITNAADLIIGTSEYTTSTAAIGTKSFVRKRIILAGATVIELQHQCQTTAATNGFGYPSNFGVICVYADVQIRKVA